MKLIPEKMTRLFIPEGSRGVVVKVLENCLKVNRGEEIAKDGRGRPHILLRGSPEDSIVLNCMMRDLSGEMTTLMLNDYRTENSKQLISYNTLLRFVDNHPLIVSSKRSKRKSGSVDQDSEWAKARLAQCQQWYEQILIGEAIEKGNTPIPRNLPPIYVYAIAWWDEP